MRSSAHIDGHPIHPMLVVFPFAYLFGSACVDLWACATNRRQWFRTASHMNTLGLGSAVAAAIPGLIDYTFAVPPKSSAKQRATNHLIANLSALSLFALSRLARRSDDQAPAPWGLATELAGMGVLSVGGWLGGTLVTRNQIGVDHRYANAGKWNVTTRVAIDATGAVDGGAADELKVDQMKLIRIADRAGERRVVLARTERGYAAFDDRCPHRGGPLSDGTLACGTVQCPWHGSQFDVMTGRVKEGPAADPIASYPVEERNGRVMIVLDDRLRS
jgi:nitrite reductase/ring-hydroxylating ferredoxin subunit/uncharacterized membrane protein